MKTIIIKTNHKNIKVAVEDIVYLECMHNYVKILTSSAEYKTRATIKEYEKLLSADGFIRVHSGFIVNSMFVSKICYNSVTLQTGITLPISRKYSKSATLQFKNP